MLIHGKRAIAYFDILGFKAKIENIPIEKLSNDYERIIGQTDGEFSIKGGKITSRQVCYRYIFSDSIFLVAEEDTEDSFVDFISYAWRMMQHFIVTGFPLRGAITYGDIYVNFDKNIFLGKAISEAVILEGQQDWIGAVVDHSAIDRYKSVLEQDTIQSDIMRILLPIHDVPFKDMPRRNCHVLNWRQNIISQDGIKPLFKNEPYDESVQRKINNALRFSKDVVDSGMAYFKDDIVPERYRRFFVGHRLPQSPDSMFPPGDEY